MKDERKAITPAELKKNRKFATAFGIMGIIMIISMVYAFVWRVKAEKNAEEALRQATLARASEQRAMQSGMDAKKQMEMAASHQAAAEAFARPLQLELDKCRKGKSK